MSSLTISRKLFAGTASLVLLSFVLGAVALYTISSLGGQAHFILTSTLAKQKLADKIASQTALLLSLGSVEQSRGIEHISRAITQMEQTTQSSAAIAEQSAAAAQQLNAQAEALNDLINHLSVMLDGKVAHSFQRPSQPLRSVVFAHA